MIWKIKIDSLHRVKCLVDLKVVKSIRELLWSDKMRIKVNFIEYFGYIEQMAIYQKVYEKNTGEKLPMFIAAITKESVSDKEIIEIPQELLDEKIDYIAEHIVRVKNIIDGKTEPEKCGVCDYCRENKKLSKTIRY
jgi:hypothetical protein